MRLVKTFGLAAVALAATAFLGASSAVAVPEHPEIVLCKVAELPCKESNWDPLITEIHAETLLTEPPKLLTSIGTVLCEESLAIVTVLNHLAKLIEGHILGLSFSKCHLNNPAKPCTVTVNELGGLSITPAEQKLLAEVESIELEGRTTKVTVKCGSLINCTYSAGEETELTVHSDALGHILLLAVDTPLKNSGGIFCPKGKWDAEYHAIDLGEELTLKTGLWIEL